MMKTLAACMAPAALLAAAPAQAVLLDFRITGDANIFFQLDSNPVPDFTIDDILPVFNFYGGLYYNGREYFGTVFFLPVGPREGGFSVGDNISFYHEATGAQLFSGPASAPVFQTGSWSFTDSFYGGPDSVDYTMTITKAAAAIPEPASWALMLAGFSVVGAGLRSRRRKLTVAFA